jgi:hypothetical protein
MDINSDATTMATEIFPLFNSSEISTFLRRKSKEKYEANNNTIPINPNIKDPKAPIKKFSGMSSPFYAYSILGSSAKSIISKPSLYS